MTASQALGGRAGGVEAPIHDGVGTGSAQLETASPVAELSFADVRMMAGALTSHELFSTSDGGQRLASVLPADSIF